LKGLGDVAVRVDADSRIGIGHVQRCVVLARQLRLDGFAVRLVVRHQLNSAVEPLIEDIPISWLEMTEGAVDEARARSKEEYDAELTLSVVGRRVAGFSWVIVDHYDLGERWEGCIRAVGHRVLAIDDFRTRRHCADVLVSDTGARFDATLNGCPGKAYELAGPRFAIVDPAFAFSEDTPCSTEGTRLLLVSYGGSDPTDETTKALEAVRVLRHNEAFRHCVGAVDVVVGQANPRAGKVRRFAEGIGDVAVHVGPRSLAPLMRQASLFLTAGGNSLVEALTMRKPCVVTLTDDNQALMMAQVGGHRAVVFLGPHALVGPPEVASGVMQVLADYDQRVSDVRAQPLFDQYGAARISAAIQSIQRDQL